MKREIGRELAVEAVVFMLTIGAIAFFWPYNYLLTALLLAIFLLSNLFWYKKYDYLIYIPAMIMGTVVDIVIAYVGAWEFQNPSFLFVPLWLPIAWTIAAITLLKSYETLKKIFK